MNYNILTYLIFLPIICFITFRVGWLFYHYGEVHLINIFLGNKEIAKSINSLLLLGYYLLNIGYATLTIYYWEDVNDLFGLITSLFKDLGKIILVLSGMHYLNLIWIKILSKNITNN